MKRGSAFVFGISFMIIGLLGSFALFFRCFTTAYKNSFVDFPIMFSCITSPLTLTLISIGLIVAGIGTIIFHFATPNPQP